MRHTPARSTPTITTRSAARATATARGGDNAEAPDGNPFNTNRVGADHAASACFDDEANDDELDGDERLNYQARARNDPTRVTAGTMNRRRDLDKYLREEVEEEADRAWWGRHEY